MMFPMTTDDVETTGTGQIPVLLTLGNIAQLVEGQATSTTVYKWNTNTAKRPRWLPVPDLSIGDRRPTPVWRESVILEFLESKGYRVNKRALARIRKSQGHPPN